MASQHGAERIIAIVGLDEVDPQRSYVSWISPCARALTKGREGDIIALRTPAGVEGLEILPLSTRRSILICPGHHNWRQNRRINGMHKRHRRYSCRMQSNSSLEQLESALKDAMLRLKALAEENSRLRAELVDKSERMRTAGNKLRVVAERLPNRRKKPRRARLRYSNRHRKSRWHEHHAQSHHPRTYISPRRTGLRGQSLAEPLRWSRLNAH